MQLNKNDDNRKTFGLDICSFHFLCAYEANLLKFKKCIFHRIYGKVDIWYI